MTPGGGGVIASVPLVRATRPRDPAGVRIEEAEAAIVREMFAAAEVPRTLGQCPKPVESTWQLMRDNRLSIATPAATTTSSTIAATPGTGSSSSPGTSCPSDCAHGF